MFRFVIFVCGLFFSMHAFADMPSTKRWKQEKTFSFGDVQIKQSFNSMKDPMDPEFKVRVYDKGRLVLQLNDAAFDAFFSSPDGGAFVGLSNSGWPGTAVIIFERRGRILLLAEHGLARFDYCGETATFVKDWYDSKDPQVRFPPFKLGGEGRDRTPGITLKSCHGETIDLLDTVTKATANGEMTLRDEINIHYGTR
ncbi:hypothetical protein GM658_19265 [Pseudoduganella eburnea]|uniref:Uncharacterized protein n=1 Tax=Massilia eburnea TaxID=1776165 RepID=A0A6L6QKR3_9BURK|nr:hypothetical protein [Massilia eburnea]MTW12751.1 hypothetical protein [Massilia eburnea]